MFMDQSAYHHQQQQQQHQSSSTSEQFYNGDSMVLGKYSAQFNHYQLENMDVSRHICPVCNKSFRASSLLDIHMRVHVGAKPFVCPVCNHRATQKGNLKLHMKKHHGRDLPSHIDLVPDSGIWGNFPQMEGPSAEDLNNSRIPQKKAALAHSSLLNEEVVDLIKKCQNNIGQSTMGRITESLKDFLDMAKQKTSVSNGSSSSKHVELTEQKSIDNANSNNNMKMSRLKQTNGNINPLKKIAVENGFQQVKLQKSGESLPVEPALEKHYCYCKVCGWKTTSSGYLNVHMRKHKAESHICTICGRAFKETWYLKNHMRSHINDLGCSAEGRFAEIMQNNLNFNSVDPTKVNALQEIDEKKLHEINDKKATHSMCLNCGLIFGNDLINNHNRVCGKVKQHVAKCKLCDKENSKEVFMEALDLKTDSLLLKEPINATQFNPMIGNSIIYPSQANNSSSDLHKTLNDSILAFKKEIENSIKQNGLKATEENFRELMKNPEFKSLFSQGHLNSIEELFYASSPSVRNGKSMMQKPLEKMQHSANGGDNILKPYRNPAMQSLAEIGKSMMAHTDTQWCDSPENDAKDKDQHPQGFQCHFCPKWFKYRSVLGIHMRSHTGERPYKCTYCGYAGTQHNCLKLHIQRHHPKEYMEFHSNPANKFQMSEPKNDIEQEHMLLGQVAKFAPARCPICGRVSPSPGYLKIHMRSHKKTLDHVCHICGRGFKEYWYLSTHLRTHDHEINVQPVKEEQETFEVPVSPNCTPRMQTTLRNTLLSKRQSLPLASRDHRHMGHSYLSGTSSWSPLNLHEDLTAASPIPSAAVEKHETPRQYVSKRKAFQPSRHRVEPYITQSETTRSRKSKPRKFSQGSYLTPTLQELPYNICGNEDSESEEDCAIYTTRTDNEQPLDLSVSTITMQHGQSCVEDEQFNDEPLNLAIK